MRVRLQGCSPAPGGFRGNSRDMVDRGLGNSESSGESGACAQRDSRPVILQSFCPALAEPRKTAWKE